MTDQNPTVKDSKEYKALLDKVRQLELDLHLYKKKEEQNTGCTCCNERT